MKTTRPLKKHVYSILIAACCAWSLPMAAERDSPSREAVAGALPELEEFIRFGMEESHVPGLAISIVYNDEVILSKGFGVRKQGSAELVDASTLFQVASLSKPITASVLATVVGTGAVSWQTKICDIDPSFRLSDPWVTAELTIEDLLAHRSGLPDHAGDLLEDLKFPAAEIFHALRFIAPLHGFRSAYAYTNFGFSEAAFAVAKKLSTSWPALAKERIFAPLHMSSSTYSFEEYWQTPNKALSHQIREGQAEALEMRNADAQGPAGGASSNAKDIANWMIALLAEGKYLGQQVIDATALEATFQPLITSGHDIETKAPLFYGMGWAIKWDAQGRKILSHNGGFTLGVRSYIALMPRDKLGIAIFTNSAWHGLPEAVVDYFYDKVYARSTRKDLLALWNKRWSTLDNEKHYTKKTGDITPSLSLENYVGRYGNDYYGPIEIKLQAGQLVLSIGPSSLFPLQHYDRDVFTFATGGENRIGDAQVIFSFDAQKMVHNLYIDYLDAHGNGTFLPL